VPTFYARLAALTAMTRTGLGDRGLLSRDDSANLERLEGLALDLQVIAENELRSEPLTQQDYDLIRYYGGELEHLTMAAADTEEGEPGGNTYMDEEPQAAVVADVATDPLPQLVLEEAVGRVDEIHVVVPVVDDDGTVYLQVAKGAVFSYYEFPWPAADRLTDEKWRKMLEDGQPPARPTWTGTFFTAKGESSDLTQAVYSFQQSLANAVWNLEPGYLSAGGPALEQLTADIDTLLADKQYEGRQLIRNEFRSFDLQTADRAVVTVRETWQDKLYGFQDYPGGGDTEPLAERGPYTLDVTYTLERGEWQWLVTRIVYANEPPAW